MNHAIKNRRTIIGLSTAVICENGVFTPLARQFCEATFADLKYDGLAAALRAGFADRVIVVGGLEPVPLCDAPDGAAETFGVVDGHVMIPRGHAGCQVMIETHGADAAKLGFEVSRPNTAGNVDTTGHITAWPQPGETFTMSAGFFHLLRAYYDVTPHVRAKVGVCPSEAYLLAEAQIKGRSVEPIVDRLRTAFGGGALCDKIIQELRGISQKIVGTYVSGSIPG